MPDFVHLHNHSDFSLLDGAVSIDRLVQKAKDLGMKHLALTDHGNMFGALRFYKACKAAGINPIIGCEFYLAPKSRHIKSGSESSEKYHHLVLLAKSERGYRNLMALASIGYTEGFYYKPRIDDEVLAVYKDDLVCSSACLAGEIPSLILAGKFEAAKTRALYYNGLFGQDNYYLELQDHGIEDQRTANEGLIRLSRETGIPLIATNDIHYLERDHANAQDILICIGTGKKKADPKRLKFESTEFYFKSGAQMAALFPETPEAIANTVKIAEMCNVTIPLPGPLLPEYEIPPEFSSPEDYVRHITYQGLAELYGGLSPEVKERADYELDIIFSMGFTGYFLIVWDFIAYARKNGIPVGPGRGSGAGSIVAYGMRITDIDPLKYSLLFERFLNPERVSMPDFDIDFCFEQRGKVIDYVTRKYGAEKVGQIITFGTLKPKAVLKDVARVLDISFAESNEISKLVPDGPKVTLSSALEMEPALKEYRERGGVYKELIDTAEVLEGLNRHSSTHAAGVVIGRTKLTDYVPLFMDHKTGQISTEFTMDLLEDCGLVKMDFLGLKTLTLIKNTESLVRKTDPKFDIEKVSEEDELTFKLLGEGKSVGVFQFESSGMQAILRQAKPSSIEELIALNALYRPGPMQFIPQYIDSKLGKTPISYPHEDLKEILEPTYGVIVYQEQVMQVAQIIGGFSLGKADILRRAMGKKKEKEMEKMKVEFLEGAVQRGYKKDLADSIFEMLKPFAGYGFNKSHAAAYSVLAYKTAYLKAHYPAEFLAANLTNEINSPDGFALFMAETKGMGIPLLPPNINKSDKTFSVVEGQIFYGLMGIKNVGGAAVDEIIRVREAEGHFTSFLDFLMRVDGKTVNKKVIETLVYAGVFDEFKINRKTLIENLEGVTEFVSREKEASQFGQSSLFEDSAEEPIHHYDFIPAEEYTTMEILQFEKEYLGQYFSGHPLETYRKTWERCTNLNLSKPGNGIRDKVYTILGIVKTLRTIITKKGQQMAFITVEDFNGSVEVILFPKTWEQFRHLVAADAIIGIQGKMDNAKEEAKILADRIISPEELKESEQKEVHIRISYEMQDEDAFINMRSVMIDNAGSSAVYLHLDRPGDKQDIIVKASPQIGIGSDNYVLDQLRSAPYVLDVWKE
ncbi:MAG: DNA polymerase III subunit alpha [Spirochaetales bacterium]|nr:DNA polymerase III subunit alpha [Spirochaetales bacterium]